MDKEIKTDKFQLWINTYMGDDYDIKIIKQKTIDSVLSNYEMYKDNYDFELKSIIMDVIFDIMRKPNFMYSESVKLNMLDVIGDVDKMVDELYAIIVDWNLVIDSKRHLE
jgi:hypothetical protein